MLVSINFLKNSMEKYSRRTLYAISRKLSE